MSPIGIGLGGGGGGSRGPRYRVTVSDARPIAGGTTVTVTAQLVYADGTDNAISGLTVHWTKRGPARGSLSGSTSTTDSGGAATVTFTQSTVAGDTFAIVATDDEDVSGTSPAIIVQAAAASQYLVTLDTLSPDAGADDLVVAQLADTYSNHVHTAGAVVTWSNTGTGATFSSATSTTDALGRATVIFTVGDGPTYTVTATDGGSLTGTSDTISVGGSVDALIAALVAGEYNGADVKAWKAATTGATGGFPHPETDTQLAAWTLDSATLVDDTHATVTMVTAAATVMGSTLHSPPTDAKYLTIEKLGQPTITRSIGTATEVGGVSAVFGADIQFPDPSSGSLDWFSGDRVTLASFDVAAIDSTLTGFSVTPSDLAPPQASSITTTVQAKAGMADLHAIGLAVTASLDVISGSGGGSITSPDLVSNAYGLFEELTVADVGDYPTDEKISVTGSTLTSESADIIVADLVDSYDVSSSDDVPGPGATVTITAQAKLSGSNANVAGRVVTWSGGGDGGFGAATSTTDSSGVATVSFTVGSTLATVYNVVATDAQGETGTSEDITVTAVAPAYTDIDSASMLTDAHTATFPRSVTFAPNSRAIVWLASEQDGLAGNASDTVVDDGGGLTWVAVDDIGGANFAGTIHFKAMTALVGPGGYTGTPTFTGTIFFLPLMATFGQIAATSPSDAIVQHASDKDETSAASFGVAYSTAPAASRLLLAGFAAFKSGGITGTPTSRSGWTTESFFDGGGVGSPTGKAIQVQSRGTTDTQSGISWSGSVPETWLGIVIEVKG